MRKFVTDIENNALLLGVPRALTAEHLGLPHGGPGVVAIYCGPAGAPILERCELQPDQVMELRGAHFVLQSRDRLGAVVFIAST
jgi:hypothetical protein